MSLSFGFDFDKVFLEMMESRSLKKVVILGHMNPDGDAAGSVMGLAHYIRSNYPEYIPIPYLARTLDKGPQKQIREDRVFQPFHQPDPIAEPYGVIVCDTATVARIIGREYYENAAFSIVIDHHASDEGYGDVNNTFISESCAENITRMLSPDLLKKAAEELHPNAADYLYMGILHDTNVFNRAGVSTLKTAAFLQEAGVCHRYVMKTVLTQTLEDLEKEAMILSMAKRAFDGEVAYVCVDKKMAAEKNIGYEDIHPISGILRDCEDISLGFTMYEEALDIWRCSFRSDTDWINVNELLLPYGGGGHAAAAGLRKATDDPESLLQNILNDVKKLRN